MKTNNKNKADFVQMKGEALLTRVKDLEYLTTEEKAKVCGYYTIRGDGTERLHLMKFLNALIDAEGIELDGRSSNGSIRGGRRANYRISVQASGNLLIGSAYTKKMDLQPGDEFEISLGNRRIHLKHVTAESEKSEAIGLASRR